MVAKVWSEDVLKDDAYKSNLDAVGANFALKTTSAEFVFNSRNSYSFKTLQH